MPETENLSLVADGPIEAEAPSELEASDKPEEPAPEGTGQIPAGAKGESRARRAFRKFIRWTAGLLIVFGLGFLSALFTLYTPKVAELALSQTDLQTAEQQIADLETKVGNLEAQVDSLTSEQADLESANAGLQDQLAAAQAEALEKQTLFDLKALFLNARLEIARAQIALYDENPGLARALLANIAKSLAQLESLLPAENRSAVPTMQDRLDSALSLVETNPANAIDDLDILAGDLQELEEALLSGQ